MRSAFALLHSPLVGPSTWQLVNEQLPIDTRLILVAHSGTGPLLPRRRRAIAPSQRLCIRRCWLPRDGASRLDLLAAEIPPAAAQLRELLASGGRYPTWQDEDLRTSIPDPELRRRTLTRRSDPVPGARLVSATEAHRMGSRHVRGHP